MIVAKVRGFRGAEKADLQIDPVVLLGGLNGAGKSSVCQAIAAACTGQPIPFYRPNRPDKPMFTKADSKGLLRAGMETGVSVLEVDGKVEATVAWPDLTFSGTDSLHCSLYAAGLVNPMELDDVERQRFFAGLLQADPTMADLIEALKEAVPVLANPEYSEALDKITTMVKTNGYDVSHKHFREQGARRKGEWEGKSGEAFGARKAGDWKPAGWRDDLEGKTLEDLGTACTKAQEALEKAVAEVATDAANLSQLQKQAGEEVRAWNALKEAEGDHERAQDEHKRMALAHSQVAVPTATACPHCGGFLDITTDLAGAFTVVESSANAEEIQHARDAKAAAKIALEQAAKIAHTREQVYNQARAAYSAVKGSGDKLAETKTRTGSTDAVDVARDYLNGVVRDKDLVDRRRACAILAQQISANQKVVDILSPEGLRRQKLQKALAAFNKGLAALCTEASYSAVTVDDGLDILYGGRRYFLLSGSEQYRVRAVLQVAIALYDNSPLVILDGADILDQAGRNGLFAMMPLAEGVSFLVGMTVMAEKNVPDLAKAGIGVSMWMEDGIARPLNGAMA